MSNETKTTPETMGQWLAARRKEQSLTQAELAAKMGVTDKAVSKWERDLSFPDVASLPRLADIFGVSVDELIRVKTTTAPAEKPRVLPSLTLICAAVCLAMGVATVVLLILGEIDVNTALTFLAVGVAAAGAALLAKK